ncbi:ACT domain-containing protein [Acetivibrio straminisolvens]|jgi:aspartokinase|uniref:aspartate kinase n=1 Tax=Acetivibrio straminisolvens JCM 21531 TaxID=1294263 RepID=W4V354_9FIRM|nr:amino acid-binding protein [Acetivibrio straminisolvens]GAE87552.1 aspartokinase [Acetivibrio straminisolvens JCM 21531]
MSQKADANIDMSYDTALMTIRNVPNDIRLISDIFTSIADEDINIQMITKTPQHQGHVNVLFCLPSEDLFRVLTVLNKYKSIAKDLLIEVDAYNTKISIFCGERKNFPSLVAKIFRLFADEEIDIKLATCSESEISCLIHEYDSDKAASLIQ